MLYPEINGKEASGKRLTLHSSHWTLDIEPCVFCSMRLPHPMNSRTATVSHSYHWIPNHHRIRCGERLATAKVWTSSLAMMQFHKENGFFWNAHEWMINAFLGSFFGCSSRPRQTVRLAYAFLRLTRKKLAGYFRGPKTTEPWKCKSGPWKIAAFCCREWVEVFLVKEGIFLNSWNLSINTCESNIFLGTRTKHTFRHRCYRRPCCYPPPHHHYHHSHDHHGHHGHDGHHRHCRRHLSSQGGMVGGVRGFPPRGTSVCSHEHNFSPSARIQAPHDIAWCCVPSCRGMCSSPIGQDYW